jgi:hypothetical protein
VCRGFGFFFQLLGGPGTLFLPFFPFLQGAYRKKNYSKTTRARGKKFYQKKGKLTSQKRRAQVLQSQKKGPKKKQKKKRKKENKKKKRKKETKWTVSAPRLPA